LNTNDKRAHWRRANTSKHHNFDSFFFSNQVTDIIDFSASSILHLTSAQHIASITMPTKRYKSARAAAQYEKKKPEMLAEAPSSPTNAAVDVPPPEAPHSDPSFTPMTLAISDTSTPFLPSTPYTQPSSTATPHDSGTELLDPPPYQLPPPVTAVATPRIELTPKAAAFFAKWLPQFHAYVQAFPPNEDYEAFPAFCHRGIDLLIAFTRDVTKEHITKKTLPHDELLTPPGAPAQENIFTNPFFATDKIKNFLDINFERWRLFMYDREELEGRKWEEVGEKHQGDVKELLERVERLCEAGAWERTNRKVKELKREGRFGEKYVPVKKGGKEGEDVESGEEGGDEGEKKATVEKKSRRKKRKERLAVEDSEGEAAGDEGVMADIEVGDGEVGAQKGEDLKEAEMNGGDGDNARTHHEKVVDDTPSNAKDHKSVDNAVEAAQAEREAAVQQEAMRQHVREKRMQRLAIRGVQVDPEDSD
jgi:hypothetical protein